MPVSALHHFTIRCTPDELPPLVDFYTRVMRLEPGARPEIPAPGAWLYAHGQPIVHLYAHLSEPDRPVQPVTGHVDHIAFRSQGLAEMRAHLRALDIPFDEAPIPGWAIHQLFLRDPRGLRIEMTFWLDQEAEGAA
ncbi:catechol 2,3-dioxygenase-like lactoylglutathione lyase family enzyme [Variovorax sp. TBS-050B]|uniref:VOC family protein n=1 Tax=Variovorax sp. TBS-050B TaxID=2940551 RepID=UPI002474DD59|nr:VOC family protein [Variovorax sp. TBS-050B]MDH6590325.1 catechol 2,3-dioxygenase-like lactoylglutathione lyase family enzyme [Variovorax sp. TBS-050B]